MFGHLHPVKSVETHAHSRDEHKTWIKDILIEAEEFFLPVDKREIILAL